MYYAFALCMGLAIALQAPINAVLARSLGGSVLVSALISFLVGGSVFCFWHYFASTQNRAYQYVFNRFSRTTHHKYDFRQHRGFWTKRKAYFLAKNRRLTHNARRTFALFFKRTQRRIKAF